MPHTIQSDDHKIIEFLGKHFVALLVTYRLRDDRPDQPPRVEAVSGTIFRINGAFSYLTAGHCLERVHQLLSSDQVEVLAVSLADAFGKGRINDHPVPISLAADELHYIDQGGLDVGIIPLWPYYVRSLLANGIVPLDQESWIHQHKVKFDAYFMLGLPSEFCSGVISDNGETSVEPTILRVTELDPESDKSEPTEFPRFVARLDSELPIQSIDGMSGGPIFGFRFGDETRYWIVALQSRWRAQSRIVYGSPLPVIGSILTEAFKQFKEAS